MRFSPVTCFVCVACVVFVPLLLVLMLVAMFVGKYYGNRYAGRYGTDWYRRAAAAS
ncbi:MAG: hypothetical protein HY420_00465 [Candidatus Kerfeldbacteria bacterium]|nr:hypothetical protein [Candidatus Kerfeldbacteria bacterium]